MPPAHYSSSGFHQPPRECCKVFISEESNFVFPFCMADLCGSFILSSYFGAVAYWNTRLETQQADVYFYFKTNQEAHRFKLQPAISYRTSPSIRGSNTASCLHLACFQKMSQPSTSLGYTTM